MMKDSADIKKLGEMIKDIRIAMLTTVDKQGKLHSRPMATQTKVEFDGDLWFFTRGHGEKIEELGHDSHVSLAYSKPDESRYVSVSGIGKIVHDDTKMRELWDKSFEDYFPGGLSDPDLALLKVEVEGAEYWSTPGPSAPGPARSPVFNRSVLTSRGKPQGEHGKVELNETRH